MKNNKGIAEKASQNVTDRLVWQTAHKDQAGISRELASGKEIPEVYGLGEAGLFDESFFFLDNFGISKLFKGLDPELKQRQPNVNFHTVMLIYMMRIVSGVSYFWHIEPVLLASQPLMRLVGFNGRQIRRGTSLRGLSKTDKLAQENDPEGSEKIRGPICPDSVASCIVTIKASALERFFNGVISILAANSFFAANIHASLDASEIQSTESCTGCGKVSKEKAPELRRRKGRIRKVFETVFGFKIWVVWDKKGDSLLSSRRSRNGKSETVPFLSLAVRFTTIEVGDVIMAQEVVAQAITNLGEHAILASLAFDRGFIDGTTCGG